MTFSCRTDNDRKCQLLILNSGESWRQWKFKEYASPAGPNAVRENYSGLNNRLVYKLTCWPGNIHYHTISVRNNWGQKRSGSLEAHFNLFLKKQWRQQQQKTGAFIFRYKRLGHMEEFIGHPNSVVFTAHFCRIPLKVWIHWVKQSSVKLPTC